jgi:hypothetical protein
MRNSISKPGDPNLLETRSTKRARGHKKDIHDTQSDGGSVRMKAFEDSGLLEGGAFDPRKLTRDGNSVTGSANLNQS